MKKTTKSMVRPDETHQLFLDLSLLIEQSKRAVVSHVNNTMAVLFWQIGGRVNGHVLDHKRARYGEQIVATVSRQLVLAHGRNFEEKNLRRMMQFAAFFPESEIVVTLSRQLSWSHFLALIPLKNREARQFYAEAASREGWGVRQLRENIESKVFERKLSCWRCTKTVSWWLNTGRNCRRRRNWRTNCIRRSSTRENCWSGASHCHKSPRSDNTRCGVARSSIAERYGVKQFVMISTDKAVNPKGLMGISKRLAERVAKFVHSLKSQVELANLKGLYDETREMVPEMRGPTFEEMMSRVFG